MAKPRSLVDLAAAVSSALLMNESQWVGIIVRPINYPLKGAVLHIDTGPGLRIEERHGIEIEKHEVGAQNMDNMDNPPDNLSPVSAEVKQLSLEDGKIKLPDWTSNITSVLWIPLQAVSDGLAKGTPAGWYQKNFVVLIFKGYPSVLGITICLYLYRYSCFSETECCGWIEDDCSET